MLSPIKKFLHLALGGLSALLAPSACKTASKATPADNPKPHAIAATVNVAAAGAADNAVVGNNAFGLALYRQLANQQGNIVLSPASISMALAMTYAGAQKETARQMRQALRITGEANQVHGGWATILNSWQTSEKVEISVANRIFGAKQFAFEAPFLTLTKQRYGAPLLPVDFKGAPEAQRERINAWVAKQTHERITGLIPPGAITAETRMALVNALYFKGRWLHPFPEPLTKDEAFTRDDGKKVQASMMALERPARYAEIDGVRLAERIYEGGQFAALFALPPSGQKLAALEKTLTGSQFARWTEALKTHQVSLKLPRFTLEPEAPRELSGALKALGMPLAFDPDKADFKGISKPAQPDDELFLQKVFHKAFVAMDEVGTEAAAATAVLMVPRGAPPPAAPVRAKRFHADRPFLFFIRDTSTGLLLFAGRVLDPTI